MYRLLKSLFFGWLALVVLLAIFVTVNLSSSTSGNLAAFLLAREENRFHRPKKRCKNRNPKHLRPSTTPCLQTMEHAFFSTRERPEATGILTHPQ